MNLLDTAQYLHNLGYKTAYTQGKRFIKQYTPTIKVLTCIGPIELEDDQAPKDYNGISLILDNIICVDFDSKDTYDLELPNTWIEETPRGMHFFYKLVYDKCIYKAGSKKIKHSGKNIDILTKTKSDNSDSKNHVVISPTAGYKRRTEIPSLKDLPPAPMWAIKVLLEPNTEQNKRLVKGYGTVSY